MLTNVKLIIKRIKSFQDPKLIYRLWGIEEVGRLIETGIYTGCLNLEHRLPFRLELDELYPCSGCYGVADNLDQIKELFKEQINDPDKRYIIQTYVIERHKQPKQGGWRRHKRGEYIGDKNPQHEYLTDEDDSIQDVITYHIYDVTKHTGKQK